MTNVRIDDDRVVELASGFPPKSNYEIARELGCDEASVRRALKRKEFKRNQIPMDLESRFHFNIDEPIVLQDADVMVTADWHIPLYDPGYVNIMIQAAQDLGIDTLIIAGDFFNFDALSRFEPKQDEAGLARELNEGLAVMSVLLETFKKIYYIWGNHDARMHRALGFAIQFREAMKMVFGALGTELLDRIEFTNLDHMWVEFTDTGERWYICHPASYSRVPLSNPRQLAAKYDANIICAHSHHAAIGHAVNGKHTVVEAGGLFDKDKTAYLQRTTTYPTWQQGFGAFLGGRFLLSTPQWGTSLLL